MPRASAFGVYIHFPYCLSKCPYCDFASVVASSIPHRAYALAVARELERRAAEHGRPRAGAESIYFGGGTPSLWDPACVGATLEKIDTLFGIAPGCEITLEANPGASDTAAFAALRAAGVNRLSLGVQSFHPEALAGLGRRHTPEEAVAALERAQEAGFPEVSIDLIFGAPGQTPETAEADARRAVELGTTHLSFYGLTLEGLAEDVRLAKDVRRGRVQVPDDGAQERMGTLVRAVLAGAGFPRYEISNFARPGSECRHNLLYWRGGEYAAAGCGAWGFRRVGQGGFRYGNPRKPGPYLAAVERGDDPAAEFDEIDPAGLFVERLFLGLRLVDGLDLDDAVRDTVGTLPSSTARAIDALVADGLLERQGSRLRCTERGLDLHTEVSVRLLPDEGPERAPLPVIG